MIISSRMSYFPEFAQPYLKNVYARNLWIMLLGRGKKERKELGFIFGSQRGSLAS